MKIMTKKSEKEMMTKATAAGWEAGFNAAVDTCILSLGAGVIVGMMFNGITDIAISRGLYKAATSDQNLDQTLKKAGSILSKFKRRDKKGLKQLVSYLYKSAKLGFTGWNPDIVKMTYVSLFTLFREYSSEVKNAVYSLRGPGADLIVKAFEDWEENGTMIFPYGPAEKWPEVLRREYKFVADITLANNIASCVKNGSASKQDYLDLVKLAKSIEDVINDALNDIHNFEDNDYEYWNSYHIIDVANERIESETSSISVDETDEGIHIMIPEFKGQNFSMGFGEKKKEGFFNHAKRTLTPPKKAVKSKKPEPEIWDIDANEEEDDDDVSVTAPEPGVEAGEKIEETKQPEESKKVAATSDKKELDEIKAALVGCKRAKNADSKRRAKKLLHNLVQKYISTRNMSVAEFLEMYPTVKEEY